MQSVFAWLRKYRWPLVGVAVVVLVVAFFALRSLSKRLEERFHATHDSIPTRVYSSVYWIRPGVGASVEELRYRLHERDYREVRPGEVKAPGTYSIEIDEQKRPLILHVHTNEFPYPPVAKEVIFGNPEADTAAAEYTVTWSGGAVSKVMGPAGELPAGFTIEPILVARLNEGNKEARKTVPLADIPHTLLEAIELTEDQRFQEHIGFDLRGIARSIWVNIRSGGRAVQGASTITQQLARNMYLNNKRTLLRKLEELFVSVFLELHFTKDEILEKYANEVYFGQSGNIAIHGVAEAAKFYFNKQLEDLTIAEQALMTGIIKGPPFYSPFRHLDRAKVRQEIVLGKMRDAGVITADQFKSSLAEPIRLARASSIQNRAPYFTDMVQAQLLKDLPDQETVGSGYTIFSTLDTYYQQLAEKSVANGVARVEANIAKFVELEAKRKAKQKKRKIPAKEESPVDDKPEQGERLVEGVFVAVDPANGQILALVGGRSYEESTFNRALLMKRHIGSLIKPFVYLSALINGRNPDGTPLNSISKFEDKPFTYEFDKKSWSPKNFEDEFEGTVTMRYALARSINTVAAQVAIATGLDNVVGTARSAGFEGDLRALPSLSLGAFDAPPLDVTRAYNTLANFGLKRELTSALAILADDGRPIAKFTPRDERALPVEESANIVQLMTSVFEIGTAHPSRAAGFNWPAAGKTGTTNEFRDAWFAGFTRKVLGISWIGFDRDDEIVRKHRKALKLTGAVAALPVWTEFMNGAHKNQDPLDLAYPDGALRKLEVDLISGGKANIRCLGQNVVEEYFTYRNAPSHDCN